MRVLLLCAVALLAIDMCACGSTDRPHGAASGASTNEVLGNPAERDEDGDIDTKGMGPPYDVDNDAVPEYGPPASATDRRAIEAVLRRYYTVAAAGDGAAACRILDPLLVEAMLEEHKGRGAPALRGSDCAQIMSKLFELHHRELVEDVADFRITVVQVKGKRGVALAPFAPTREVQLIVHREHGRWSMDVALSNGAE